MGMNMEKANRLKLGSLTGGLALCALTVAGVVSCTQNEQKTVATASAKDWVGKTAAPFALPGIDGAMVDLSKSMGKSPVVLIFYRGNW